MLAAAPPLSRSSFGMPEVEDQVKRLIWALPLAKLLLIGGIVVKVALWMGDVNRGLSELKAGSDRVQTDVDAIRNGFKHDLDALRGEQSEVVARVTAVEALVRERGEVLDRHDRRIATIEARR